jgi:hypothetical protein
MSAYIGASDLLGLSALLGIAAGSLSVAIAIAAFPIREECAAAFTRKPGPENTFASQTKFTTKAVII